MVNFLIRIFNYIFIKIHTPSQNDLTFLYFQIPILWRLHALEPDFINTRTKLNTSLQFNPAHRHRMKRPRVTKMTKIFLSSFSFNMLNNMLSLILLWFEPSLKKFACVSHFWTPLSFYLWLRFWPFDPR